MKPKLSCFATCNHLQTWSTLIALHYTSHNNHMYLTYTIYNGSAFSSWHCKQCCQSMFFYYFLPVRRKPEEEEWFVLNYFADRSSSAQVNNCMFASSSHMSSVSPSAVHFVSTVLVILFFRAATERLRLTNETKFTTIYSVSLLERYPVCLSKKPTSLM